MRQLPTITSSSLDPSVVLLHNASVLNEANAKYLDNRKEMINKGHGDYTTSVFFNDYYFQLMQAYFRNVKFYRKENSCKIKYKTGRFETDSIGVFLSRIRDYLTQWGFTVGEMDIQHGILSKTVTFEVVERVIVSNLPEWRRVIEVVDGLMYERAAVFQCRQSSYKTELIRAETLPAEVQNWIMLVSNYRQMYYVQAD